MEEANPEQAMTELQKSEAAPSKPAMPSGIVHPPQRSSALDKTVSVLRTVLPIAQKVLPLIDGQIGTVVSNLIAPQASPRQVAQSLLPLQEGLAQLEKQQVELRAQATGQNAALKHIDEQIAVLGKLAGDTAEKQRNLADSLEKTRRKITVFAIAGLLLLAGLLALNVILLLRAR
jgi:hypothetical protein